MVDRLPGSRIKVVRLVDARIEELKERLRLTHDLGCQLVAEIVRLERERLAYLEGHDGRGTNHPRPVLIVKSA